MTDASIIGKVAVRVWADTRGFKEQVRKAVEDSDDLKVRIDLKADTAKFRAETAAAVKDAQRRAKAVKIRVDLDDPAELRQGIAEVDKMLKSLDRTEIEVKMERGELNAARDLLKERLGIVGNTMKVGIEVDNDASVRRAIAKAEAELSKIREQEIEIALDEESLDKFIKDTQRELEWRTRQFDGLEASMRLRADNESFRLLRRQVDEEFSKIEISPDLDQEQVRRLSRELDERLFRKNEILPLMMDPTISDRDKQELRRELEDIDADIKVGISQLSARHVQGRLAWLARTRFAEIYPRINEAAAAKAGAALAALSGGRAVFEIGDDLFNWVRDLDKAVPKISAVSLGIAGVAASLLTATSNTLAFAGSLATTAGAALALPGILGGIGFGLAATVVGFKDFNKYLPEVRQKFSDLREVMSENFWGEAEKPMRRFINTIFPQFRKGMSLTGTEVGSFFGKLATSTRLAFGDDSMVNMFKDLGESIKIASSHTDSFAGILQKLGELGAGYLPRMAGWVGDVADRFDNWLGRSDLEGFVDTGIRALKDLGTTLRYTGVFFRELYKAAEQAGGSTLAQTAKTMKSAADAVREGTPFFEGFVRVLAAAHDGMSAIAEGSGQQFKAFMSTLSETLPKILRISGRGLGDLFGGLFDALGQARMQSAAVGFFESLERSISSLKPALAPTARGLAGIVDVLGAITEVTSTAVASALERIGPALDDLSGSLTPLTRELGKLVNAGMELLGSTFADLAPVVGVMAGALTDLLRPINMLVDAFKLLPGPVQSGLGALTSLGVLIGGGMWIGHAVATKVGVFSAQLANMAVQAGVGHRALATLSQTTHTLSSRMRGKAGIAGMVTALGAMTVEAKSSNKVVDVLMGTLTGAGFGAAGGPWGMIAGGIAGLGTSLLGLKQGATEAKPPVEQVTEATWDYSAALDAVAGSSRRALREEALRGLKDTIQYTDELGISTRDLVSASLGNEKATRRVNAAIEENATSTKWMIDAYGRITGSYEHVSKAGREVQKAIGASTEQLAKQRAEANQASSAINGLGKHYKGLPKQVITHIKNEGVPTVEADVRRIVRQFGELLTPKEIKLLIRKSPDLDLTKTEVENLMGLLDKVKGNKPEVDVKPGKGTRRAREDVEQLDKTVGKLRGKQHTFEVKSKGAAKVKNDLKEVSDHAKNVGRKPVSVKVEAKGAKKARQEINSVNEAVRDAGSAKPKTRAPLQTLEKSVQSSRKSVRADVKNVNKALREAGNVKPNMTPFMNGIRAAVTGARMVAYAGAVAVGSALKSGVLAGFAGVESALVSRAVSAVRAAISAARRAGDIRSPSRKMKYIGQMLVAGLRAGLSGGDKVAARMGRRAVEAYVSNASVKKIDKRFNKINKLVDNKLKKASKGARKAIQAQVKELKKLEKALDKHMQKIKKQAEAVKALQAEKSAYMSSVAEAVTATGDPTRDGANSWKAVITNVRLARDEAVNFAKTMKDLVKAGLNVDTLKMLVSAGPEAGLGAAMAILKGGPDAIDELNKLQDEINKAAAELGKTAGDAVYDGQIEAEKAALQQLKNAAAPLAKALDKLSKQTLKRLRKAISNNVPKMNKQLRSLAKDLDKVLNKWDKVNKKQNKNQAKSATRNNKNVLGPGGGTVANTASNNNARVVNIYYTANGTGSTEEDLFALANRARLVV